MFNCDTENLLHFCKTSKKLVLYGTGKYAKILSDVLEWYNVEIFAYCVSNTQKKTNSQMIKNTPIYHVSELFEKTECNVVLAMSEKWHDEVLSEINNEGYAFHEMIVPKDESFLELWMWLQICQFNKPYSVREINQYENKLQELKRKFDMIEFRIGFGYTIGGCLLELFFHKTYKLLPSTTYFIFYIYDSKNPTCFKHPNEFAIKFFEGDNFSAINDETIDFWRYVFQNHWDLIRTNTKYNYIDNIMEESIKRMHEGQFTNADVNLIDFSGEEEQCGQKTLEKMEISPRQYVCIYARDAGFYQAIYDEIDEPLKIMDYYRNTNITSFSAASEYLNERQIISVRVGSHVKCAMDIKLGIDYANAHRTDFMDFYLAKNCLFYLGDHSGAMFFQAFFGTPMVITNLPSITGYADGTFPFVKSRDLMIFHKFWSTRLNRLLNLSEILAIEDCSEEPYKYSGSVHIFEKYYEHGIVPIANTAEEILAVTKEMIGRLDGTYIYDSDDNGLQKQFWNILTPFINKRKSVYWFDAMVGRDFLRDNLWLVK